MSDNQWKEVEYGWFIDQQIGGVRLGIGGWTVFPKWLPDSHEFDVGPFSSARYAKSVAEKMFARMTADAMEGEG